MLLQCNNYVIKRQKLYFFIAKSPFSSYGKIASIAIPLAVNALPFY